MPIVQIDWTEIKSRLADDTALYALTLRQSALLLALSEQLHWDKTFRAFNYDFADYDTLQGDISDLEANLMSPVDISQLFGYIDDIENLLSDIKGLSGCCPGTYDITAGEQYTDTVEDGVGNVPQNIVDAGYASSTSDWTGFNNYKCMIANVMVEHMVVVLNQLDDAVDVSGNIIGGIATVIGLISAIFTSGLSLLAAGILSSAGIAAALYDDVSDFGTLGALATKVSNNKTKLVCAMMDADGNEEALEFLKDGIDANFTVLEAAILKNLNLKAILFSLYAGRYDATDIADKLASAGYQTANYSCLCFSGAFYTEMTYDSNADGWSLEANKWQWGGSYGNPGGGIRAVWSWTPGIFAKLTTGTLITRAGLTPGAGDQVRINAIVFDVFTSSGSFLTLQVKKDGGNALSKNYNPTVWTQQIESSFTPGWLTHSANAILGTQNSGSGDVRIDNFKIWYDVQQ